ncbi:LEF1 [Orgyia pseudotsugata single capsid nuclopolyhedrovirus]|nr:LEF1 [Orgyia pseudotsugata single capsid nuclopolyhedrovirus]
MSLFGSQAPVNYSERQALQLWNAVAYNDCRQFAFFDGTHWQHPKHCFDTFNNFYEFVVKNKVKDVHVKALFDGGGREWVVDVDFKEKDKALLDLKILVAQRTFINFFGDSVARVMHSGNRGIHVWLKIDRFRMSADKLFRARYYKAFVKPKVIDVKKITPGSFIYNLKSVIDCADIKAEIQHYVNSNNNNDNDFAVTQQILQDFWPDVDQHVFCNLNQIRAPFSFNSKGNKFSVQLH